MHDKGNQKKKGGGKLVKLTPKQQKFADEYIISGNAYQSALKAGYSENYAKARSSEMLDNVGIKKFLDDKMDAMANKSIADQTEVMEYLTRLMRGEEKETEMMNVGNFEQELVEVPVKHNIRKQAAELIGKRYSMWTDKQDVNLSGTVVFVDDVPLDDDD